MVTLGIDSSDEFISVGLADASGRAIISESSAADTRNKNALHGFLKDVLQKAGVELGGIGAVSVAIGPGSFTGLRVGLAVAKGICWSLRLPLAGVSSLMAVASCSKITGGLIVAVKDARRSEFYYAGYSFDGSEPEQVIADSVGPAGDVVELMSKGFVPVGPGLIELKKKAPDAHFDDDGNYDRQGLGGAVAVLGQRLLADGKALDLATSAPNYVRVIRPREWRP